MQSSRPAVDRETAAELARRLWGFTVKDVSELPSYDDRNFKVTTAGANDAHRPHEWGLDALPMHSGRALQRPQRMTGFQ